MRNELLAERLKAQNTELDNAPPRRRASQQRQDAFLSPPPATTCANPCMLSDCSLTY